MRKIITLLLMIAGTLVANARPLWAQATATFTPTWTPTNTRTNTPTYTPTNTITTTFSFPTATHTVTSSPTNTATFTPTDTFFNPSITPTNIPTNSPTNTPTSTPTNTSTLTITPTTSATACATSAYWAETSAGPGSAAVTGTLFQKYTLSQLSQVNTLITQLQVVSAGTSIRMGIYNDGGTYPTNLIYATQLVGAYNGINAIYIGADNINLGAGSYWLALDIVGTASVTGSGSGVTPALITLNGYDMPNPFPPALNPGIDNINKYYLSAMINTCNPAATTTPLPTSTTVPTATFTPTPVPTSGPATMIYLNTDVAVATALGVPVAIVDEARQLGLTPEITYILILLTTHCGCHPHDLMVLRLNMGWDDIVAYYGLDWTSFVNQVNSLTAGLVPEGTTVNEILRTDANDPTVFPVVVPPTPVPTSQGLTFLPPLAGAACP